MSPLELTGIETLSHIISHQITPILYSLHWLPISCRIQYQVSSLFHCSLFEGGPRYLSELLYKDTPSHQLRSSSDSFTLRVPTTNRKNYGERSFSFTGPTVWNSLLLDIRSIGSTPSVRQVLKTHHFKSYFVSNSIQPLPYSHSHHHALYIVSSPVILLSIPPSHICRQSL